jgi:cytidylate kinase
MPQVSSKEKHLKYRVLTVSREFGSGGLRIATIVAGWLGWKLLDNEIITAIARRAKVGERQVSHYDERVASWLRRMNEEAVRSVATALGQPLRETDIFDARMMIELTRKIVEEAYAEGNCVIVGRASQCILERRPDVFHTFVYAPMKERVDRICARMAVGANVNVEQRIRAVDEARAKYLQQHFGKHWGNFQLYELMVRSCPGENKTARVIYYAMTGEMPPEPVGDAASANSEHRAVGGRE